MNSLVYLFELDSEQRGSSALQQAQEALFCEIIQKGNTVVISMNQLLDSLFFKQFLVSDKQYETFRSLLVAGAIKILVDSERFPTPSKYLQNLLQAAEHLEFGLLDDLLTKDVEVRKELITDLLAALQQQDLRPLEEKVEKHKGEAKEHYTYLLRLMKLAIFMSMDTKFLLPQKGEDGTQLVDVMKVITKADCWGTQDIPEEFLIFCDTFNQYILKDDTSETIVGEKFDLNKRTDLFRMCNREPQVCKIISLAYNITIQNNIPGVDKPYMELSDATFKEYFCQKIEESTRELDSQDTSTFGFYKWDVFARIRTMDNTLPSFISKEYWTKRLRLQVPYGFLLAMSYIVLFLLSSKLFDLMEGWLLDVMHEITLPAIMMQFLEVLITFFIMDILANLLQKHVKVFQKAPDILESFKMLVHAFHDVIYRKKIERSIKRGDR